MPAATPAHTESYRPGGAVMEAMWLMAVVLIPMATSPLVVNGFQPVKMMLLRLVGLVLLGAWAVRFAELPVVRLRRAASPSRVILWGGVALLVLMYCVSSVFSLDPGLSVWGSFSDRKGLLSFLAGALIFLTGASELRTTRQWDRLTLALILPTLPICLLAISQRLGYDPMSVVAQSSVADRGGVSLAGQPIYLAAHLAMVVPFTLSRFLGTRDWPGRILVGGILLLQLLTILLSQSRGPLLGLLVGLTGFLMVWGGQCGRRRWLLGAGAGAVGLLVFLGVLAIPGGPFAGLASQGPLARLATVAPIAGSPDSFRARMWETAAEMQLQAPPSRLATGSGAETLPNVLFTYWTTDKHFHRMVNSYHNSFWDTLFQFGIVGLTASLALFAASILLAWGPTWRAGGFAAGGAVFIGVNALLIWRFGWGFLGLGVQVGLALGLIAATAWDAFCRRTPQVATLPPARLALIAVGAALVSHLVETAFAFEVPATTLLFWVCLGAAMAGVQHAENATEPAAPARPDPWTLPLLAGACGVCLSFTLVQGYFDGPMSWSDILYRSLIQAPNAGSESFVLLLVVAPSLLGMAALGAGGSFQSFLRVVLVGSGLTCAFAIYKAAHLAALGRVFLAETDVVQGFLKRAVAAEHLTHGWLMGLALVGTGLALSLARGAPRRLSWRGWVAAVLAVGGILAVSPALLLNYLHADAAVQWSNTLSSQNGLKAAQARLKILERAVDLEPSHIIAYEDFAEVSQMLAVNERGQGARDFTLERATTLLRDGIALSPHNGLPRIAAQLHSVWAQVTQDPALRRSRAEAAAHYYDLALDYDPSDANLWVGSAVVHGTLLGNAEEDRARMEKAKRWIVPEYGYHWGAAFMDQVPRALAPDIQRRYADQAVHSYDKWLSANPKPSSYKLEAYMKLAFLHNNMGRPDLARAALENALAQGDFPERWETHAALAETLLNLGDRPAALAEMDRAIQEAPLEKGAELRRARRQFFGHSPALSVP